MRKLHSAARMNLAKAAIEGRKATIAAFALLTKQLVKFLDRLLRQHDRFLSLEIDLRSVLPIDGYGEFSR